MVDKQAGQGDATKLAADTAALIQTWFAALPDLKPGSPTTEKLTIKAIGDDGRITLTWVYPTGKTPSTVTSWRGGTDTTGAGPWSETETTNTRERVFDKLANGTPYPVRVTVVYTDATTDTVDGIATPTGPTTGDPGTPPTPGTRRIPHPRKSGLPFPSIVFAGGSPELSVLEQKKNERGRPYDGIMWFVGRGTWDDFRQNWRDAKTILDQGYLLVSRVPHAPQNLGAGINAQAAAGGFEAELIAFARWMVTQGFNRENHVLSVNWEFNGDWYVWSAKYGGPDTMKKVLRHYVDCMRKGGLDKVKYDLCANKGPSQSGHDFDCWPGEDVFDSFSVDFYDQWNPSYTDADWNREMAKRPAPGSTRDFVRSLTTGNRPPVMHALSEGGNTHPKDANHGGDNGFYWRKIGQWYHDPFNNTDCAWHCTYDHNGAPESLKHMLKDNPNGRAEYMQWFGSGWKG